MGSWKLFAIVVPVFMIVDLFWLGFVMKDFYSRELGEIARRQGTSLAPRWGVALLVYIVIPAGMLLFVRPHLGADATLGEAAIWGAIYGCVTYGIYDLTNLATLERWSVRLTVADMTWGTVLCAIMSVFMYTVERRLLA